MVSQSLFHFTKFLFVSACLFESTAVFAGTTSKPPSLKSMEETKPSTVRKQALKADAIPPLTQLCRQTIQQEMNAEDEENSGFYNSMNVLRHFLSNGSGVLDESEHLKLFQEALSIVIHHLFPKDFSEAQLQILELKSTKALFANFKEKHLDFEKLLAQAMGSYFGGYNSDNRWNREKCWSLQQLLALWSKLENQDEVRALIKRSLEDTTFTIGNFADLAKYPFLSNISLTIMPEACQELEKFLLTYPHIERLTLKISETISKKHLQTISRISVLKELDLYSIQAGAIPILGELPKVCHITIKNVPFAQLSILEKVPNLCIYSDRENPTLWSHSFDPNPIYFGHFSPKLLADVRSVRAFLMPNFNLGLFSSNSNVKFNVLPSTDFSLTDWSSIEMPPLELPQFEFPTFELPPLELPLLDVPDDDVAPNRVPSLTQLCRQTIQQEMNAEDEENSGFYNSI